MPRSIASSPSTVQLDIAGLPADAPGATSPDAPSKPRSSRRAGTSNDTAPVDSNSAERNAEEPTNSFAAELHQELEKPTPSSEFYRLVHRDNTRAENEYLTLALGEQPPRTIYFEGPLPEAPVALGSVLVSFGGKRVLLVTADADILAEREIRYASRIPVRRLSSNERPAQRLPKGPLLVLASLEQWPVLARRLSSEGFDAILVEGAEMVSPEAPEYRPALARLPTLLDRVGSPVTYFARHIADSARAKVKEALSLAPEQHTTVREELLHFSVRVAAATGLSELLTVIEELPRPALVVCGTPTQTDATYTALSEQQVPCHRFHGAMSPGERASELMQFALPGRRAVLVATSSFAPEAHSGAQPKLSEHFGRGYGRADLRSVVHVGLPASLEQLGSECGLLSRNPGEKSHVLVLVEPDLREVEELPHDDLVLEVLAKKRPSGEVLDSVLSVLTSRARGAVFSEQELIASTAGRRRALLVLNMLVETGLVSLSTEGSARQYSLSLEGLPQREHGGSGGFKEALLEKSSELRGAFDRLFSGDIERRRRVFEWARSEECRETQLVRALGDRRAGTPCGACDVCAPLATRTGTEPSDHAEALAAFYRSLAPDERRRSSEELSDAEDAPATDVA